MAHRRRGRWAARQPPAAQARAEASWRPPGRPPPRGNGGGEACWSGPSELTTNAQWQVTGYLVWAAVIYAALGTWLTHLVGRALIWLNFYQQRYEADFQFNLVRVRENAEQIALLSGEPEERRRLLDRFGFVVSNWRAIMTRTKWLTGFTSGYSQFSSVFPFVVVSPAYFAKAIPFGTLIQTASAFGSVQGALSVIVTQYRSIAEWRAVIERLAGFSAAIEAGRTIATAPPVVEHEALAQARRVEIRGLELRLPNGQPLIAVDGLNFGPGEHVLVTGPTGSGKSTLFRAIAGIWPFGLGSITVPAGARLMVLPQRPYLPVDTLRAATTYPSPSDRFSTEATRSALEAVGLAKLTGRLDEMGHWNRMLSLGEQQRLAVARALLHAPDYLLLDEATASLDEASEATLYNLLQERLPNASIVSIGHRSTLGAFHRRSVVVTGDGDRFHAREATLSRPMRALRDHHQRTGQDPRRTALCQEAKATSRRTPTATAPPGSSTSCR